MHRTQRQLLGLVSIDIVHRGPSNMHRCRVFPFVFAGYLVTGDPNWFIWCTKYVHC